MYVNLVADQRMWRCMGLCVRAVLHRVECAIVCPGL